MITSFFLFRCSAPFPSVFSKKLSHILVHKSRQLACDIFQSSSFLNSIFVIGICLLNKNHNRINAKQTSENLKNKLFLSIFRRLLLQWKNFLNCYMFMVSNPVTTVKTVNFKQIIFLFLTTSIIDWTQVTSIQVNFKLVLPH